MISKYSDYTISDGSNALVKEPWVDFNYLRMVDEGVISPNEFRDMYMEKDLKTNEEKFYTYTTTIVSDGAGIIIDPSPANWYITAGTVNGSKPLPKHFNCKFCGAPNQIDVCEYCGCAYEE